MTEVTPEPQEQEVNVAQEAATENLESHDENGDDSQKMVPLSALQKQRRKTQQMQEELEHYKQKAEQAPQEEDYSRFESVTREELAKAKEETVRDVREAAWVEANPERATYVEQELQDFLKARPNLAHAIQNSPNRIREAWDLLSALSPKQKAKTQQQQQQANVPGSPGIMPKAAALNETVDVMNMSDSEFRAWRKSKKR